MGTIEDLIFRIPLERSQFSTLFLNVAQSSEQSNYNFVCQPDNGAGIFFETSQNSPNFLMHQTYSFDQNQLQNPSY
jgi:hypothetical protein